MCKSKNLNKQFNDIIERATGIGTEKRYGQTKARAVGADKGRFNLLGIPPSAQDFVGLTRYFAGKGKQGEADQTFFEDNLVKPYLKGISAMESQRQALKNDYSTFLCEGSFKQHQQTFPCTFRLFLIVNRRVRWTPSV